LLVVDDTRHSLVLDPNRAQIFRAVTDFVAELG